MKDESASLRAEQSPAENTASNTGIGALIGYLRDHYGEEAVARVVAMAGETRPLTELEDSAVWSSESQSENLYAAAEKVTGDPHLPRKVGAQLLVRYSSAEVLELLRSVNDIGASLHLVTEAASSHTTAAIFTCVEAGERHALVSARHRLSPAPSSRMCQFAEGVFSSLPIHLGMPPAVVAQLECTAKGDAQCLFDI